MSKIKSQDLCYVSGCPITFDSLYFNVQCNVDCSSDHLLTNHNAGSMSVDAAPSVDEQRRIISFLGEEPTSTYAYFVSTEWYEKWLRYVGYETQQTPDKADCPGSLTMHRNHNAIVHVHSGYIPSGIYFEAVAAIRPNQGDDGCNTLVDENIWLKWVQWYGVADCHELDRYRLTDSSQAVFEICLLSSYSKRLKNPRKIFEISDECGYIELQLRRIYGVAAGSKTQLWVYKKSPDALFQRVLDRSSPINCVLPGLNSREQRTDNRRRKQQPRYPVSSMVL